LEQIVRIAYDQGHSDIHLGIGESPRFRARGEILRSDWPPTEPSEFQDWLRELLTPQQIDHFRQCKEFDGAHAFSFVRVRINLFDALKGAAMVLRLIPQKILSLDDLKLPQVLQELCAHPKGLLLVTGPTGSGKSTTLAAMIDWINRHQSRHILTIEDPIEFVHESRQSLIRQREVGRHTLQFHHALRAALREDPDVILVGEIRDKETLSTAMEAAQTGHLVFGTLHTNSAVKTVERVLGMYQPEEQDSVRQSLAESLMGIISQGLIKSAGGKRAAYHDLMINTDACKDYIKKGALDDVEDIMQRSEFVGMMTANQSLQRLVESGQVEADKAIAVSPRPNELSQALRGRG
jgi:twitching motility protein PilT